MRTQTNASVRRDGRSASYKLLKNGTARQGAHVPKDLRDWILLLLHHRKKRDSDVSGQSRACQRTALLPRSGYTSGFLDATWTAENWTEKLLLDCKPDST